MPQQIRTLATQLASIEIWPVGLCVAASIISTRFVPLALGVAALFWLIRWLAYGTPTVRTPADAPVALLVLMLPVTLWITPLPEVTHPQVYRLLLGIALFYALINWSTTAARLRLLFSGFVLAGLALALGATITIDWVAWSQARAISDSRVPFIPLSLYEHFPLLVSDTVNPNVMAGNLNLLLPFGLSILLFCWQGADWLHRLLALLAVATIATMLLLTQSRGGLMTCIVVLVSITSLRWRRAWLVPLATGAVVVLVSQVATGLNVAGALLQRSTTMLTARIEIWSRALAMIGDFPLTGIGMGTFLPLANQSYPFVTPIYAYSAHHAHNLFLQVAVDLGIPGLGAWLAILGIVVACAWRIYQRGKTLQDSWITTLGAGFFCSQVALIVNGMVDAVTWGMVRPAPLVWALWGGALAGWRVYRTAP